MINAIIPNGNNMALEIIFFILLRLTAFTQGQSIKTPPKDATEILGGTAEFHCEMELRQNSVMTWQHNNKVIYVFQAGREYKINITKYSTEQDGANFTLTVSNLQFSDGGTLGCRSETSHSVAKLMILEKPILFNQTWSETLYSCIVRVGGLNEYEISSGRVPQLRMFLGGTQLKGSVRKKKPSKNADYYIMRQDYRIKVQPDMEGANITCEIQTFNPSVSLMTANKVDVRGAGINAVGIDFVTWPTLTITVGGSAFYWAIVIFLLTVIIISVISIKLHLNKFH